MTDKIQRKIKGCPSKVSLLWMPVYFIWLPFGLLLVPVLGIYACALNVVNELRFRTKARREGRYITRVQLANQISSNGGTMIVDSPIIGWGVSRAWWTPDDVLSRSPTPPPEKPEIGHPFYEWAYTKYIGDKGGTAMLFGVWNGEKKAARIGMKNPELKVVNIWSGSFALANCQGCGGQFLKRDSVVCPHCGESVEYHTIEGWPE